MKQVELNDSLKAKLKTAAGEGVDASNFAVFKATAINTLPVRKKHPVYVDGVHTPGFLNQMQSALSQESLPLQIMHNGEVLPIGRIFAGEVVPTDGHTDLQVYFWIDKSTQAGLDNAALVNNGTVDQVSVAILPKAAISNKSGFDFLGPDATFENIWTGTDPDGNVMGQDGAHVIMSSLDRWYEMSLVGQGGIPGARIHSNDGSMKLAASGLDAPPLTLMLSSEQQEPIKMDLTTLVNDLTTAKTDLALSNAKATTAEAALEAANAKVAELQAQVDAAAPDAEKLVATEASLTKSKETITAMFGVVAAMTGNATGAAPEDLEAALVSFKAEAAKLSNRTPSRGLDAAAGSGDKLVSTNSNSAFKRR